MQIWSAVIQNFNEYFSTEKKPVCECVLNIFVSHQYQRLDEKNVVTRSKYIDFLLKQGVLVRENKM